MQRDVLSKLELHLNTASCNVC